ncbi:hypothetical protein [Streptomyces sp. LN704]|uniref:hypothetical protein n=1 Tax=Streptomyces sp. LN704 TaxID=3112982 RepID=UPI0037150FFB
MQPSSELPAIASSDGTLYDPDAHPAGHRPAHGRHALADTEPGISAPVLDAAAGVRKAMLVPVVTALAIGTIFVAVYLAAFHAPSARHQPLGIAASDTVAARTELALNSAAPDAYTFHRYADADAARRAIVHDEVPAALVGDARGMRLLAMPARRGRPWSPVSPRPPPRRSATPSPYGMCGRWLPGTPGDCRPSTPRSASCSPGSSSRCPRTRSPRACRSRLGRRRCWSSPPPPV